MKEEEYELIQSLTSVEVAKRALMETSIVGDDYTTVMRILTDWENRFRKQINIEEE